MLVTIPGLLDAQTLSEIESLLAAARFVDGGQSAGRDARRVKNNEELKSDAEQAGQLNQLVMGALCRHPTFQAAAMPLKLSSAFFSRYRQGHSYGRHVDNAVMGSAEGQYRPDVSITVFLSAPENYAGGELLIETDAGEQSIKLHAGHAVVYPSGSLHRVSEITQGERLAAVAWGQSMVKDPLQRALLYDLYVVKETLLGLSPDAEVGARANRAYTNLFRRWAEL